MFRSAHRGIGWLAIPDAFGAEMLALLYQFEQSQWWPEERLREQQLRQASLLLAHAATDARSLHCDPHGRVAHAPWRHSTGASCRARGAVINTGSSRFGGMICTARVPGVARERLR